MKIGRISSVNNCTFGKTKTKKAENNNNTAKHNAKLAKAILAGTMAAPVIAVAVTPAIGTNPGEFIIAQANTQDGTQDINSISNEISAVTKAGNNGKRVLSDVSIASVPVSEFYFAKENGQQILTPNSNLPKNNNGTVIVTVSDSVSDDVTEGNTLNEIIDKIYSSALNGYTGEEKQAIHNKIMDEIIQSNPSLGNFIDDEIQDGAKSYEEIGNLDLYNGTTSSNQTLDTRLLVMPSSVVYQKQAKENPNKEYVYSSQTYSPKSSTASVIKNEENLLDDEYSSLADLIYGQYGEDITDEAYRDILYAIVTSPENAGEFENVTDKMNFNELLELESITDLNRTLEENTNNYMVGLSLPSVSSLRTIESGVHFNDGDKNSIIYQISPAKISDGQNDKIIVLKDNTSGTLSEGDVYSLEDILQFYSSPDGNGRFANVQDGELVLNNNINYVDEFAANILQQAVYANLDVFAAPYEDENGIHEFGVFDVDKDFDTNGKSLEEIINHSSINLDRMKDFTFVNKEGESLYDEGVSIELPQVAYRINEGKLFKSNGKLTGKADNVEVVQITEEPEKQVVPGETTVIYLPEATTEPEKEPDATEAPETPEATPDATPDTTKAPNTTPKPAATQAPTKKPDATKAPNTTPKPAETPTPTPKRPGGGGGGYYITTVTPAPSATPEPTQAPTKEPGATQTPEPTKEPGGHTTPTATPEPTQAPTKEPDATQTPEPTKEPGGHTTPTATPEPTQAPTKEPDATQTPEPTKEPETTPEPVIPTSEPKPTLNPNRPTPKPTDDPDATEDPNATPKPTKDPILPDEPGEAGKVTPEPDATKEPEVTKEPEATQTPVATKEPDATKEPEATKEPVTPTSEPKPTLNPARPTPKPTDDPDATEDPNATPKPTKDPILPDEPGEAGKVTPEPDATKEPGATEEPDTTATPAATPDSGATKEPDTTATPAVTEEPTATNAPSSTEEPCETIDPTKPEGEDKPGLNPGGQATQVPEGQATQVPGGQATQAPETPSTQAPDVQETCAPGDKVDPEEEHKPGLNPGGQAASSTQAPEAQATCEPGENVTPEEESKPGINNQTPASDTSTTPEDESKPGLKQGEEATAVEINTIEDKQDSKAPVSIEPPKDDNKETANDNTQAASTSEQSAPAQPAAPVAEPAPAQAAPAQQQEAPAQQQSAPKQEAPVQQAAPKQEAPKQEAPKQAAPKQEAPKQAAPKQEAPAKQEAPKQAAPKQEAPAPKSAPAAQSSSDSSSSAASGEVAKVKESKTLASRLTTLLLNKMGGKQNNNNGITYLA